MVELLKTDREGKVLTKRKYGISGEPAFLFAFKNLFLRAISVDLMIAFNNLIMKHKSIGIFFSKILLVIPLK